MRRVAFDTAAWFEVLAENPAGKRLSRDYLDSPDTKVFTPALALAEMSAKLARLDLQDRIIDALTAMDLGSEVVDLSTTSAMHSGRLLVELRQADPQASLADAIVLAIARDHGARLVSNDRAYRGQPDVDHF